MNFLINKILYDIKDYQKDNDKLYNQRLIPKFLPKKGEKIDKSS